MGGFPLFTTHLRAKYGAQIKRRKTAHMESTQQHVGLRAGALRLEDVQWRPTHLMLLLRIHEPNHNTVSRQAYQ